MHWLFGRVLLLQFPQVLAHGLVQLRRFCQLFAGNAALLAGIGLHETAIHRQVVSLHQPDFHTLPHNLLKQLLKQLRLLETTVPVL